MSKAVLKKLGVFALLLLYFGAGVADARVASNSTQAFIENVREFIDARDDLGLRIYLQKNRTRNLSLAEWSHIRTVIHLRPHVGYDLLYNWDRNKKIVSNFKDVRDTEKLLREGDSFMLRRRYKEAFSKYESVAKIMLPQIEANPNQNVIFYYTVLRNMGRALYSMGEFREAIKVYQWIKPNYPRFRQILFELTWAAFRAGYVDRALGAIASQRSGYFAKYLEPESYLLQIYLYKKLCRQLELKAIVQEIFEFQKELKSGTYGWREWSNSDVEYRTLLRLVDQSKERGLKIISVEDRKAEASKIASALHRRFRIERKRSLEHLNFILAQAKVTVSLGSKKLIPVERLPSREAWFRNGFEIWPNEVRETWYDELGRHRFMGENECGKRDS